MAKMISPRVSPLFIRRTETGLFLVDDQGRTIGGQLSTIVSNPQERPTFTVDFDIGHDVAWEGEDTPDQPALQAMFAAWAALSPANRARFTAALGLPAPSAGNLH